ncbi:hypothetical protein P5673_029718 [Acropora cervicornis]|uniref:Uncharacterized protein n=1 Tax=Acropora cervicornis TaxID=6130 RepID=A0AAD9PVB0_ACRCE|nr:hypothetical protein P5673_029718 [Acropora cervicornis]
MLGAREEARQDSKTSHLTCDIHHPRRDKDPLSITYGLSKLGWEDVFEEHNISGLESLKSHFKLTEQTRLRREWVAVVQIVQKYFLNSLQEKFIVGSSSQKLPIQGTKSSQVQLSERRNNSSSKGFSKNLSKYVYSWFPERKKKKRKTRKFDAPACFARFLAGKFKGREG